MLSITPTTRRSIWAEYGRLGHSKVKADQYAVAPAALGSPVRSYTPALTLGRHPSTSGESGAASVRSVDSAGSEVLLDLIRRGAAVSRTSLARELGLARSTVSLRVDRLLRDGLITEDGVEDSRGGRKARRLAVAPSAGLVAAIDIGASHGALVIADLSGAQLESRTLSAPPASAPAEFIDELWAQIEAVLSAEGLDRDRLRCIAIGVPAPVSYPDGRLVTPRFMPAWHGADFPSLLRSKTDAHVVVENDANLFALAEQHSIDGPPAADLLGVKLGARIGCGIIIGGRLYRGYSGAAGEISHTEVAGTARTSCVCGVPNCLESVASGGALVAQLVEQGYDLHGPQDVVALALSADPVAVAAAREAGVLIGTVLAGMVNVLNPRTVVIGGIMSASAVLVGAIRAQLFHRSLPLAADNLEVRVASDPARSGTHGAVRAALDEVFHPGRRVVRV